MIKEGRTATELLSLFRVLTHPFLLPFRPFSPTHHHIFKSCEIDIPSKKISADAEKAVILRFNCNVIGR